MWRRQCVDALRRAASHGCAAASLAPTAHRTLLRHNHRAWVSTGSTGFFLDKTKYIVNAYGPDRPGLVSALAKALVDAKGNIETTRMARLGDECNITMLVSFTEQTKEEAEAFERAAEEIPGLRGTVRRTGFRHRRDEEEVEKKTDEVLKEAAVNEGIDEDEANALAEALAATKLVHSSGAVTEKPKEPSAAVKQEEAKEEEAKEEAKTRAG